MRELPLRNSFSMSVNASIFCGASMFKPGRLLKPGYLFCHGKTDELVKRETFAACEIVRLPAHGVGKTKGKTSWTCILFYHRETSHLNPLTSCMELH